MPVTKSAIKRVGRNKRREDVNRARIGRVRTFIKKVESALAEGDKSSAQIALKLAQPEIQRGVTKGVIHRNLAARKISRLAQRIKAL